MTEPDPPPDRARDVPGVRKAVIVTLIIIGRRYPLRGSKATLQKPAHRPRNKPGASQKQRGGDLGHGLCRVNRRPLLSQDGTGVNFGVGDRMDAPTSRQPLARAQKTGQGPQNDGRFDGWTLITAVAAVGITPGLSI